MVVVLAGEYSEACTNWVSFWLDVFGRIMFVWFVVGFSCAACFLLRLK